MVELIDFLNADAKVINDLTERLDKNRYLVRHGFVGSKFYTFGLTDKGKRVLPPLPEDEMELAQAGLRPADVTILKRADQNPGLVNERLAAILKMDPEELNPAIIHLLTLGYLSHSGIWRRRIHATAKARQVVATYVSQSEA
jgi:SSS family solute:Na+ symporter